jgi:predicted DNA-binding ribbon-helix-helix protein
MKSKMLKRSVTVHGHKSSVSLEDTFWSGLREIARAQGCSVSNLIAKIDKGRQVGNLSSAIRIFVLEHFRAKANGQAESGRAASSEGSPV